MKNYSATNKRSCKVTPTERDAVSKGDALTIFENHEFGRIQVVVINGEPHFASADVCKALGYVNTRDAVKRHTDTDDVVFHDIIDSLGRVQKSTFINESGVYALIFGSKLPSAKAFKRWVTSEVLPAIRKTGRYAVPSQDEQAEIQKLKQELWDVDQYLWKYLEEIRQLKQALTAEMRSHTDALSKGTKYLEMYMNAVRIAEHFHDLYLKASIRETRYSCLLGALKEAQEKCLSDHHFRL